MSGEPEDELLEDSPEDPPEPELHQLEVPAGAAPSRIDRFLAETLGLPRSRLQRWLEAGLVTIDGRPASKPSAVVMPGQRLVVAPPAPPAQRIEPEEGPLAILYEDEDLIALDKPAGLAVHPGAGRQSGTLAHYLLHRFPEIAGVGGDGRPGIVHRLDMDTTGLMLVARSDFAYGALQRLFANRELEKTYLALVHGEPKEGAGRIDLPIGRHPSERQKMAIRESGRPAATRWQKIAGRRHFSLLKLQLETGRTHQIRVHAKAIGHPLLGDPVYGENRRGAPLHVQRAIDSFLRPALNARRLIFEHPRDGRRMVLEAAVAADLLDLWARLAGEPWPQEGSSEARSV
jgi:23S rRNA pseudouridine1911/1915/1917 synthase